MNHDFDTLMIDIANKLGLAKPIVVCGDFIWFKTGVFFTIASSPPRVAVQIGFGTGPALLTTIEFAALVGHEFGHMVHGRARQIGAWVIHHSADLLCDTWLENRVMPVIVEVVRFRTRRQNHRREFEADSSACTIVSAAAVGRVLVKLEAFDKAFEELWDHGKIGNVEPDLNGETVADVAQYFKRLTMVESTQLIIRNFARNREVFVRCSQRAKELDEPCNSHPLCRDRLERLGLDWDSVQDSCDFDAASLINFDLFRNWAKDQSRVIAVPDGKRLVNANV